MSLDLNLFDNDFSVTQALVLMDSEECGLTINDLEILNSKDTLAQLEQPESTGRLSNMGSTGSMSPISEMSEDPSDDVIAALGAYGKLTDNTYGNLQEAFAAYFLPGESHEHGESGMTLSTQGASYPKRATRGKRSRYADDDDDSSDSRTKAARQAKLNRERKKEYITGLETRVKALEKENADLDLRTRSKDHVIADLRDEVRYLRGVLANQTTLSKLLRNINFDEFSDVRDSHVSESDHSGYCYRPETSSTDAGVCLHVSSGAVSLELCRRCSEKASTSSVIHSGD